MSQGRPSGMVAVLFTDLVGSTDLMSRVGEPAFDEIRRGHFAALGQAVECAGGREIKNTGDGVMATFGSVVDAIRCAIAVQQATERQARRTGAPISIRVGLSIGEATFEDGDVFGAPVVEAARLVAAAGRGQIVTTVIAKALAAGRAEAEFVDLGFLELKGLPQPVAACEVRWEPLPEPTVPMPGMLTDVGRIFVGRDAELERLGQLWKEAMASERRVALLAGEPGVGKTRLAAELAAIAHEGGATVLAGRCDEDLGVPYQPFVEGLRHFVDHTAPEDLAGRLGRYGGELGRLVPELAERVPDLPPALRSDPETERYRLFDAVAAWLTAASAREPFLLVLDDLQWAAKPTLLLLRHVVRSPDTKRLLVLGTYRDTELGHEHPLVEVVADLRRQGSVERISLIGLDSTGVLAFMEQAAGHALDDEDLVLARAVHEETEGNPFFVREVLRHLTETGAVDRRRGRWGTRLPVEQFCIPESVRDVVGRRLSRLSEGANQALRIAAVAGPEFELPVVQEAGRFDQEALLSGLEEATEARLVIEATARRYRFAHALVRDSLYGELSAARRVTLHRRVAEAIETVHAGRLDDHLPALAHHYARASAPSTETAKAVEYAARAGDRALAQLAHDEAVAYYHQALELQEVGGESGDDGRRLDLLIALGEAERRAGFPAHRETLLKAAQLARARGDAVALTRAVLANVRQGLPPIAETDVDRVTALESALEMYGDRDSSIRARLLATLGLELTYAGDRQRCRQLSDEALAEARRVDDQATLANVLAARPYTILAPGTAAERWDNSNELVATAGRLGDPALLAWGHFHRYRAAMERGEIQEAGADVEALQRLAGQLGQPTLRWCGAWVRAAYLAFLGRIDEAEEQGHVAAELGEATGQPDWGLFVLSLQFVVRFEQGRVGETRKLLVETIARYPSSRAHRALLALLETEMDRLDAAREFFEDLAASDFTDVPLDSLWSVTSGTLATVAAGLDDRPRSAMLHRLLLPWANEIAGTAAMWLGAVTYYLGLLTVVLGDFEEAEDHFTAAEATHIRIGAPTWLARTRLEWARMLLTRRQPGDAGRAAELLGRALAIARELGLANVERRAVALLQ